MRSHRSRAGHSVRTNPIHQFVQRLITFINRITLSALFLAFSPALLVSSQENLRSCAKPIPVDEPTTIEIGVNEKHCYAVALKVNEFFQVRVEQRDVDVKIRFLGPDGEQLGQMDSPNGLQGFEILSFAAFTAADYTLEVLTHPQNKKGGSYTIQRQAGRTATAQDRRRMQIEKTFADGSIALDNQKLELAFATFNSALIGWQELKDDYMLRSTSECIASLEEALSKRDPNTSWKHLLVDKPLTRDIKGGQTHFYTIELKRGEVVRTVAKEKNIDVSMAVINLGNEEVSVGSFYGSGDGQEKLTFVAEKDGMYAVGMSPANVPSSGSYDFSGSWSAVATEADQKHVKTQQLVSEGMGLLADTSNAGLRKAIAKHEKAFKGWSELLEEYLAQITKTRLTQLKATLAANLLSEGKKLVAEGTIESLYLALSGLEEARAIYREFDDILKEMECVTHLLIVSLLVDEQAKVIDYSNQAIAFQKAQRPFLGEKYTSVSIAMSLRGIAHAYFSLGDFVKSHEYYRRSLEAVKRVGVMKSKDPKRPEPDESWLPDLKYLTYVGLGQVHEFQGHKAEALKNYQKARYFSKFSKKKEQAIQFLNVIGAFYLNSGERDKAIPYLEEALKQLESNSNSLSKSFTLNLTGNIYLERGDIKTALKYYLQALALTQAGIPQSESGLDALLGKYQEIFSRAVSLNQVAIAYWRLGNSQQASEYLRQALALSRLVKNRRIQGKLLATLGEMQRELGDSENAMISQIEALGLLKETGDKGELARVFRETGLIFFLQGDGQKAIEHLEQARHISEGVGNNREKMMATSALGVISSSLGDQEKSLRYHKQALALAEAADNKDAIASQTGSIGTYYYELGDYDQARKYQEKSLALFEAIESKDGEAYARNNLGNIYQKQGENDRALKQMEAALAIFREANKRSLIAAVLDNIGNVHRLKGDSQTALNHHAEALMLYAATKYFSGEAYNYRKFQEAWAAKGKPRLAVFFGKMAVNRYQALRQGSRSVDSKETQQSFIKSIEKPYKTLAGILISEGRSDEAQQVINLSRDQEFFDISLDRTQVPAKLDLTPREEANGRLLQAALDRTKNTFRPLDDLKSKIGINQPTAEEARELEQLESEFKLATDALQTTLRQVEADFEQPASERDRIAKPLDPAQMADSECQPRDAANVGVPDAEKLKYALCKLEKAQSKKYAAIYAVTTESDFYALLVTREGLKTFSHPTKAVALKEKVQGFLEVLGCPRFDPTQKSSDLYKTILKSTSTAGQNITLEEELEKEKINVLLWSLDGPLRYIPVAALYDESKRQFLVEKYESAVFTRASTEGFLHEPKPWMQGVGLGLSRQYTLISGPRGVEEALFTIFGDEEKRQKGILSGPVLLNDNFTVAAFTNLRGRWPLIHVASHFVFSAGNSRESYLLLGKAQQFKLFEMQNYPNLFAGVELLTLSACETAAQQSNADGKEIDGFAELAQRLGARSVIATLWKISDQETSKLMIDFYRQHREHQDWSKSELLRQTQLNFLKGKVNVAPETPGALKEKHVETCEVNDKLAKRFVPDPKAPFAHPFYWSAFVLYGGPR